METQAQKFLFLASLAVIFVTLVYLNDNEVYDDDDDDDTEIRIRLI